MIGEQLKDKFTESYSIEGPNSKQMIHDSCFVQTDNSKIKSNTPNFENESTNPGEKYSQQSLNDFQKRVKQQLEKWLKTNKLAKCLISETELKIRLYGLYQLRDKLNQRKILNLISSCGYPYFKTKQNITDQLIKKIFNIEDQQVIWYIDDYQQIIASQENQIKIIQEKINDSKAQCLQIAIRQLKISIYCNNIEQILKTISRVQKFFKRYSLDNKQCSKLIKNLILQNHPGKRIQLLQKLMNEMFWKTILQKELPKPPNFREKQKSNQTTPGSFNSTPSPSAMQHLNCSIEYLKEMCKQTLKLGEFSLTQLYIRELKEIANNSKKQKLCDEIRKFALKYFKLKTDQYKRYLNNFLKQDSEQAEKMYLQIIKSIKDYLVESDKHLGLMSFAFEEKERPKAKIDKILALTLEQPIKMLENPKLIVGELKRKYIMKCLQLIRLRSQEQYVKLIYGLLTVKTQFFDAETQTVNEQNEQMSEQKKFIQILKRSQKLPFAGQLLKFFTNYDTKQLNQKSAYFIKELSIWYKLLAQQINKQIKCFEPTLLNLINVYEQNSKQIYDVFLKIYPNSLRQIEEVRTFQQKLNLICNKADEISTILLQRLCNTSINYSSLQQSSLILSGVTFLQSSLQISKIHGPAKLKQVDELFSIISVMTNMLSFHQQRLQSVNQSRILQMNPLNNGSGREQIGIISLSKEKIQLKLISILNKIQQMNQPSSVKKYQINYQLINSILVLHSFKQNGLGLLQKLRRRIDKILEGLICKMYLPLTSALALTSAREQDYNFYALCKTLTYADKLKNVLQSEAYKYLKHSQFFQGLIERCNVNNLAKIVHDKMKSVRSAQIQISQMFSQYGQVLNRFIINGKELNQIKQTRQKYIKDQQTLVFKLAQHIAHNQMLKLIKVKFPSIQDVNHQRDINQQRDINHYMYMPGSELDIISSLLLKFAQISNNKKYIQKKTQRQLIIMQTQFYFFLEIYAELQKLKQKFKEQSFLKSFKRNLKLETNIQALINRQIKRPEIKSKYEQLKQQILDNFSTGCISLTKLQQFLKNPALDHEYYKNQLSDLFGKILEEFDKKILSIYQPKQKIIHLANIDLIVKAFEFVELYNSTQLICKEQLLPVDKKEKISLWIKVSHLLFDQIKRNFECLVEKHKQKKYDISLQVFQLRHIQSYIEARMKNEYKTYRDLKNLTRNHQDNYDISIRQTMNITN